MADLPTWVALSLPQAWSPAEVVERANLRGAGASLTRDGIQFASGFLARIDPSPFPKRLLDNALSERPVDTGHATLLISGGTNELERSDHRRPAALREMAKAAAIRALGPPDPNAPIESNASRKMMALTKLVHKLAPLATAVVLPRANHIAFDMRAYAELANEYIGGGAYTFPLWSYLKVREDEGASFVASTGMWTFGLPDVGMPWGNGIDVNEAVSVVGALQREMVAEGWWPEDGAVFPTKLGPVDIARTWDGLWVVPSSLRSTEATQLARRRFARQQQMGALLGDRTHHHRPGEQGQFAIEHFLRHDDVSMAITNGLSDRPQPGGTQGEENDYVELTLTSSELGPWADGWLDWASQYMRDHDGSHPIRARDRLVLPQPSRGIAGAIVWPMGHLSPEKPGEPTVALWDLMPFSSDELAHFRADPTAQAAWMEERHLRGDFAEIHARWRVCARDP